MRELDGWAATKAWTEKGVSARQAGQGYKQMAETVPIVG